MPPPGWPHSGSRNRSLITALWRTWSRLSLRRAPRRRSSDENRLECTCADAATEKPDGASGRCAEALFPREVFPGGVARGLKETGKYGRELRGAFTRKTGPDFRVAEHCTNRTCRCRFAASRERRNRTVLQARQPIRIARGQREGTRLLRSWCSPMVGHSSERVDGEKSRDTRSVNRMIARLCVSYVYTYTRTYITRADTYTLLYIYYAIMLRWWSIQIYYVGNVYWIDTNE